MRAFLALLLLPTPALGWEFTPGLPCRLTHESPDARVELTHDPMAPLYTITITRDAPWPEAPAFAMRFDGPAALSIGTDRHVLSQDGRALTVTDRGFGNVLDGLQYNTTAWAIAGDVAVPFALDGAAAPVAAFRACEGAPLSS